MKTSPSFPYLLFILLLFSSCTNYKLNYSAEVADWKNQPLPTDQQVRHQIYLVGDIGHTQEGRPAPVPLYLKKVLSDAPESSTVIFLGDNAYRNGMPGKSDKKERAAAEKNLEMQLAAIKDFDGQVIFIPGNKDWAQYGLKGLKRQQKFIDKAINEFHGIDDDDDKDYESYFFPRNGCGDPEVIEVNDQLVIIAIDSQWWLTDWDREQAINDGCEIKSRAIFKFQFEELMRKYRNKNVVVAMHHPLFSEGPRAGYYTVKSHLFPLTELSPNFYLPLPVVGSAVNFLRSTVSPKQDLNHRLYKDLRQAILAGSRKNGRFMFVSGHEHSMQYLEEDRQYFIISGSGALKTPTRAGKGALFGYGEYGYSRLDFYEDGTTYVSFFAISKSGQNAELVFRKKIKDKLNISEENIPDSFPEYDSRQSAVTVPAITTPVNKVGKLHRFFLGEHYRQLYLNEYEFPVLDLETFRGGMTPIKRGGGNQTNSLRMLDAENKQIVMRDLTKDASRFIPYPFNKMAATQVLVEDNFLSTHPFAPLTIPPMADAANVYHTNPQFYYIPKQPRLGVNNDIFGGSVYLVEERPSENYEDEKSFGNPDDIIGTPDVAEKLIKNTRHRIDQPWAVRTRLFDLLIGDWDRHDDQWRWAVFEEGDIKLYRPIPRDRDQPYSRYDGLITNIARLAQPFLRQLKTYSPTVKNMKWSTWSARYFDRTFLSEMTWEDWKKEAEFLKENVTDEVIEAAIRKMPPKAFEITGEKLIAITKQRRDQIVKFAKMHYDLVAKKVDVTGTDDRDRFEVNRLDNDRVLVQMFDLNKEGEKKEKVYERIFHRSETKEISLYGISDDDQFVLKGEVGESILIRIIGGLGEDEVEDNSRVTGPSKKTIVYDSSDEDNQLKLGSEGKDATNRNREQNTYDRKHQQYEYNFTIPFPILGYNPDDGLVIGANISTTVYKFKKSPYAQMHQFTGSFASSPRAFAFAYHGEFLKVLGDWDFVLDGDFKGDRFSFNYFGIGNDTPLGDFELAYNRVRQSQIRIHPALRIPLAGGNGSFTIGPFLDRTEIDRTPNRFITTDATELPDNIFQPRLFAGGLAQFRFENVDQTFNPKRGIRFNASYSYQSNLENVDLNFGQVRSEFIFYQPFDKDENVVFANRLGVASNSGVFNRQEMPGDFDFFQAPTLGGRENLRGVRAERFVGNTSFYHNLDLRAKLFTSINKVIPFSLGIHAGFDYGRVWVKDQESDRWHSSVGGGIWLAPVDILILSLGVYTSDEDMRFIFKVGHQF